MISRKFWLGLSVAIGALIGADPAYADPVTAAVTTAFTWLTGAGIAATVVRTIGLSLLGQALSKKPRAQAAAGIKTQTSTGGSTPQTFVLGKYATAGQLVAPLNTYGTDGKTPNAYLVYVVARGCIPGQTLSRLILNDDYVEVASSLSTIGGSNAQGYALGGVYAGNAWIRHYDGMQTQADPLLLDKFGSDPNRPWTSDMVGNGRPYAVLVFRYNREVLNSPPVVRFEETGIPLYDPRKDATVGGSGSQRWGQPATYATTLNPVVMIYNLHRGIALPDGSRYGGEAEAEDLPLDNWFTAMNACDEAVALDGGGTEPRFTAGLEVDVSQEPADVMEALETACQAQQVEIGGVWKIRVGGPGLPVAFFTDGDILVDRDRDHDMFPGLAETHNGIQASHPLPAALWETTDAPPRFNVDWEAADDDRRLIADLPLPAVFSPTQAQRLMKSAVDENRRFGRHSLSMGPYASMLEPLDAIAWTSEAEGYTNKVFEVTQVNEGLRTLTVEMGLRERDSADFAWDVSDELPWVAAVPGASLPVAQAVPGFSVSGSSIEDADGYERRPALMLQWDGSEMPDVRGVMWEVRVKATQVDVASGTASDVARNGVVVAEGILRATEYEARARLVVDRPTDWTSWISAITPNIRLGLDDVDAAEITAAEAAARADAIAAEAQARADELLAEQQARTAAIQAAASALQAQIDSVASQVADLNETEPYDNATAYAVGDVVKYDGKLYRAIQATTGHLPTDAAYWDKIGDYGSLGEAVAGLAVQLADLQTSVTALDGEITAEVNSRETLAAQLRGNYTGTNPAMLSQGLIYQQRQASAAADAVQVASIDALSATMKTTGAENVLRNPSFEAATAGNVNLPDGWQIGFGNGAVIESYSRPASTLDPTGVMASIFVSNMTPSPDSYADLHNAGTKTGAVAGQVWTASVWFKSPGNLRAEVVLEAQNASNAGLASYYSGRTVGNDTWQRISVTTSALPSGTAKLYTLLRIYSVTSAGPHNNTMSFDRAQLELSPVVTGWRDNGSVNAKAVESVEVRVTNIEGVNASQATALTNLNTAVAGKASSTALNALDSRVTSAEGVNSSQATQISNLQTDVAGKASASALNTLDARVTAAEGVNSSQSTALTNLNNEVAGKASSSAVNALDSRVTAAEGVNSSQATAITNLNTAVAGKASASALDSAVARITVNEGDIQAVAEDVEQVSIDLGNVTANGLFAISVEGGSGDVVSRAVLMTRASVGDTFVSSGLVLESGFTGGNPALPFSRVVIETDKFILRPPSGSGERFEFSGGNMRSYYPSGQLAARFGVW